MLALKVGNVLTLQRNSIFHTRPKICFAKLHYNNVVSVCVLSCARMFVCLSVCSQVLACESVKLQLRSVVLMMRCASRVTIHENRRNKKEY